MKRSEQNKLSETRESLRESDIARLLLSCEAVGIEDKIVATWDDILTNGKNNEKLEAIDQYLAYKYGRPKQQTDITTGGHPINSVSFDILENDSDKGE